ncbi:MAG: PAS domain S-box protein [Candidatus Aureabacteria bacterium]|nr:PAS domain S-box protein [Candidatus Auribacterota bacterium]
MDKLLRILIVEDSAADAELIARELIKGDLAHTSKWVKSKDEFLKALKEFAPGVILCDYKIPGFGAPEALEIAKEISPKTPFVVISGTIGEDIAIDTMKLGAVDYIMKDRLARLIPAVRRAMEETRIISERTQLENELSQAKEQQFRTLIENLPQKVFLKDTNSVYLSCNENYARDLKIEAEDIEGKTDYDFFPTHLAEKYRADDKRVMESGKTENIEEEYLEITDSLRGSQKMIINTVKVPVRDKTGSVTGIFGLFWDITELKEKERALRASEARYRSYVDVTGQIGWVTNVDGEVEEDIPSMRKFSGQTYEEAKGSGWSKALHPDDLERTIKVWNKAVAAKSSYEIEYRMRRHDGVYRYLLARGFPVFREDGSIREWVGTCIDITERKQVEEALRVSERTIRAVFDQTFQFIGMMTVDGMLIEVNRTAMQFAGINESDCLGKPFWDTPWWTHSKELQNKLHEAVTRAASGETVFFEATHYAADRSLHYIDFSLKPVKDRDGKVVFLIPEGHDITQRKQAEEELKRYHDHLEELVNEKTEAIKESEARFKIIFEDARDGMLLADAETKIFSMCNKTICTMLGYTEEELKRMSVHDIHPKKDLPHVIEVFEKQARGEIKLVENLPRRF